MEVHISMAAEKILQIGPFVISNSMLVTWLVTIVMIIFTRQALRNERVRDIAEMIIEGLLSFFIGPYGKCF